MLSVIAVWFVSPAISAVITVWSVKTAMSAVITVWSVTTVNVSCHYRVIYHDNNVSCHYCVICHDNNVSCHYRVICHDSNVSIRASASWSLPRYLSSELSVICWTAAPGLRNDTRGTDERSNVSFPSGGRCWSGKTLQRLQQNKKSSTKWWLVLDEILLLIFCNEKISKIQIALFKRSTTDVCVCHTCLIA